MTKRVRHEWYMNEDYCRHCGIVAISPKQQRLADLWIPCEWPSDSTNQEWELTLLTTEVIMEDGKRCSVHVHVRPEDYDAYVEALQAAWRGLVERQLDLANEYRARMQGLRSMYEAMYGTMAFGTSSDNDEGISSDSDEGISSDSDEGIENGAENGLVRPPAPRDLPAVGMDSVLEDALAEDGPRWLDQWR